MLSILYLKSRVVRISLKEWVINHTSWDKIG